MVLLFDKYLLKLAHKTIFIALFQCICHDWAGNLLENFYFRKAKIDANKKYQVDHFLSI